MADKKEPPPPPVDPAIIAKTREALSFLQKPPLTDKLLNRPPFRFVYDVVGAVIDATHFADGLFDQGQLKLTPEEMKAAWEKEEKTAFLTTILKAVEIASGQPSPVTPGMIMAGRECDKTNLFFQQLGTCAKGKFDNIALVAQARAALGLPVPSAAPVPVPAPAPAAVTPAGPSPAEEAAKKQAEEERKKKEEEEKKRAAAAAEEERKKKAAAAEEEARKKKQQEEAEAAARQKAAAEEAERKRKEEEAKKKAAAEEAQRKQQQDAAAAASQAQAQAQAAAAAEAERKRKADADASAQAAAAAEAERKRKADADAQAAAQQQQMLKEQQERERRELEQQQKAAAEKQAALAAAAFSSAQQQAQQQQQTPQAPSPDVAPSASPAIDGDSPELKAAVEQTKVLLQAMFPKPKLLEKHLPKPPFRFIFDIVRAVIQSTHYLESLFSGEELSAEYFPKDAPSNPATMAKKRAFLLKLHELVSMTVGHDVQLNPNNVISGKEGLQTNIFLQELAHGASLFTAGQVTNEQLGAALEQKHQQEAAQGGTPTQQAPSPAPATSPMMSQQQRSPSPPPPPPSVPSFPAASAAAPTPSEAESQAAAAAAQAAQAAQAALEEKEAEERRAISNISRPKTAARPPPRVKARVVEESKADVTVITSTTAPSMPAPEGAKVVEVATAAGVIKEPDSKSAAAAAEAEDADEPEPEEPLFESKEMGEGVHGKVVTDMLGQRKRRDEQKEEKSRPGQFGRLGQYADRSNKGFSKDQIEKLRESIQRTCQSVGPLGKCVDFVWEDVDSMNAELIKWQKEHQHQQQRMEEELKKTTEVLSPLQQKMQEMDAQTEEMRKKIQHLKCTLLRNDAQIQVVLDMHTGGSS